MFNIDELGRGSRVIEVLIGPGSSAGGCRVQQTELQAILRSAFVRRSSVRNLPLDSPDIKVIFGPPRSGKSSLAIQTLVNRKLAYFNFEDESVPADFSTDDWLDSLSEVYPDFDTLLLDEIQLLPKWEHLVNRLHRLGKNLVITGSNSKLLSGELASSLTGRYIELKLLPFSFAEYLVAQSKIANRQNFTDYLMSGGFPSVVTGRSDADVFLPTLWDAIILKDLVHRYGIRRSVELKNLLHLMMTNMASRVNSRSLSRALDGQLTHATVSKYISWAEGAYLCCLLQPFSFKARQRINADKKSYLYDNGFYVSQTKSGPRDMGRLLENHVFVELCRRGFEPNLDFFFFQTKSKFEVDFFLTPASGSAKLIQACYTLSGEETKKREFRALVHAARELRISDLLIITCDDAEQNFTHEGYRIRTIPAWHAWMG